ncbi:putative 4-coumarate--CoA ligase 3 [Fragariocoptes setiger]|uniref:4-coumarate--CoA ligase 3 n=1 Tax=Fragariocoptes setiger TaxID=1670756 RepID=A0ABQ7S8F1_9ACAR|nr:putative 4-coumarate--CoA ligase 3 [Fragariocoptes setiger]
MSTSDTEKSSSGENGPQIFKSKTTFKFNESDKSFGDFILRSLDKFSDTELFVDCASGHKWTGAAMSEQVRRLTTGLIVELGMRPGDIACMSYDHCDRAVALAMAIICAGGTISCAYPLDPYPELLRVIQKSQPSFFFSDIRRSEWASQLRNDLAIPSLKFIAIDSEDFETLWNGTNLEKSLDGAEMPQIPVAPHANLNEMLAFMSLSSGTTGLPKLIAATHANCIAGAYHIPLSDKYQSETEDDGRPKQITFACQTTLDYASCRLILIGALSSGYRVAIINGFQVDQFIEYIPKYGINVAYLGSAAFHSMVSECLTRSSKPDLRPLTVVFPMGANLPSLDKAREFFRIYPHVSFCLQAYGCSEACIVSFAHERTTEQFLEDPSCCGHLWMSVELKVVNPDDYRQLLPAGQTGLLLVKSPAVFAGYYDASALAAPHLLRTEGEIFDADGFYITGDLGYVNKGTHEVHFEARMGEMMRCPQKKVMPQELEQVIIQHPCVKESVVLGIKSQRTPGIDCPRAFIVPDNNTAQQIVNCSPQVHNFDSDRAKQLAKDVIEFVHARVAWMKQLTGGVCLINEIPRTRSTGKCDKQYLRSLNHSNAFIYASQAELEQSTDIAPSSGTDRKKTPKDGQRIILSERSLGVLGPMIILFSPLTSSAHPARPCLEAPEPQVIITFMNSNEYTQLVSGPEVQLLQSAVQVKR